MPEDINAITDLEVGDWIGPSETSLHLVRSIEEPEVTDGPFGGDSGSVEVKRMGEKLAASPDKDWSGDGEVVEKDGDHVSTRWQRYEGHDL